MKRVIQLAVALALSAFPAACASVGVGAQDGYSSCKYRAECSVFGVWGAEEVNHVDMGVLKFNDISCISVSYPLEYAGKESALVGKIVIVKGRIFPVDLEEAENFIYINGRRVGAGLCTDAILVVEKWSNISELRR